MFTLALIPLHNLQPVREKSFFCAIVYQKRTFYQDRLGTNKEKLRKRDCFVQGDARQQMAETCAAVGMQVATCGDQLGWCPGGAADGCIAMPSDWCALPQALY